MEAGEAYLKYLKGNEQAFETVIEKYKNPLLFFVFRYVGNLTDAEDIVEDVFFKLAIKKPRFKSDKKFSTWLFTIARNEAVSFLRKHKTSENIDDYINLSDEKSEIENEFLKEESEVKVHQALGRIPGAYREVIHLSFFCEMKNDEIAKITKKNKKQVENLLYRAKMALKRELEKEGFDYENS